MRIDTHDEDRYESESLRLRFQSKYGKRYDGRYHTAKKLFEIAWKEETCRDCQNKWFTFYFHKSHFSEEINLN